MGTGDPDLMRYGGGCSRHARRSLGWERVSIMDESRRWREWVGGHWGIAFGGAIFSERLSRVDLLRWVRDGDIA